MTPPITLYGIANCDTVKKSRAWFDEQGQHVTFHDFKKQGAPLALLRDWLKTVDWCVLLNTKGTSWRKLDESLRLSVKDGETAALLMQSQPSLIKRPVVVCGEQVCVGFAPQVWLKL